MTKEALKLALEAMGLAKHSHGVLLLSDPPQEAWKTYQVDSALSKAITAIKEALANEALEKMAENARELGLDYEPAQPFITHNVEKPYDWSEWVCPDPKNYLMKCCDCGLVHEAEFGVVRYKSETEREDCDMVDDPNLQAVFRMRRSEEWSPEDTAHRSGGLPMAKPEPIAWIWEKQDGYTSIETHSLDDEDMKNVGVKSIKPLYAKPQFIGLTEDEILSISADCAATHQHTDIHFARAIEAKLRSKNHEI